MGKRGGKDQTTPRIVQSRAHSHAQQHARHPRALKLAARFLVLLNQTFNLLGQLDWGRTSTFMLLSILGGCIAQCLYALGQLAQPCCLAVFLRQHHRCSPFFLLLCWMVAKKKKTHTHTHTHTHSPARCLTFLFWRRLWKCCFVIGYFSAVVVWAMDVDGSELLLWVNRATPSLLVSGCLACMALDRSAYSLSLVAGSLLDVAVGKVCC